MQRAVHTIDAEKRTVGQVATEAVRFLRGKHRATFVPHKDDGDIVVVKNFKKIKVTGKKLGQKRYFHHSGYLGGMHSENLEDLLKRRPEQVLRTAVRGMLPKNKLRAHQIKRLKIQL